MCLIISVLPIGLGKDRPKILFFKLLGPCSLTFSFLECSYPEHFLTHHQGISEKKKILRIRKVLNIFKIARKNCIVCTCFSKIITICLSTIKILLSVFTQLIFPHLSMIVLILGILVILTSFLFYITTF